MKQHHGLKGHDFTDLPEIANKAAATDKRRISNIPMPNKRIIQAGSAEDIEIDMSNILFAKRSSGIEIDHYRTSNRAD